MRELHEQALIFLVNRAYLSLLHLASAFRLPYSHLNPLHKQSWKLTIRTPLSQDLLAGLQERFLEHFPQHSIGLLTSPRPQIIPVVLEERSARLLHACFVRTYLSHTVEV
jgi:hypothetical protein